ncbi:MAG: HAMP domain-containing sensor histidine kinase [Patescibacteria group bacterium]|nr:HAMP domain-containing sensor histidine kinase [Patescibacteria group bacterium]
MKTVYKLSDRILIIIVGFATIFVLSSIFVLRDSIISVLILGAILYILSFFASYFISRNFSKRIMALTFKVQEMAAGNLSMRLKHNSKDEIGYLSNSINELMGRLQTGVAQDVSKHRQLNKAKTDFVAIASHQLRTPLSIIKWYVDYLICEDAGEINPEQKKYLKEVYRSNERLIELVNALLDVSRIDVGTFSIDPESTDIIERAEAAIKVLSREIENKKINLIKKYDKFPLLNLDPRLTKMVFQNILSNAVKYTPEAGIVKIVIKKIERDIFIKISDSGCGIPREEQPKMFSKMFRGLNAKKIESIGTGLGLYIVKAIVEKSGGKIWFHSPSLELLLAPGKNDSDIPLDKRNQGTTINITIPLKGMKRRAGTKKLTSIS